MITPFCCNFIASLNSRGKGAIILPHGVLFRGNREADIRRKLIRQGVIKGIIGLPANDYNLNIPRYIDASEPEDLHDLDAHLNGGIPDCDIDALGNYWTVFPSLRGELFKRNGRPGYSDPKVETQQVKTVVLNHSEFNLFRGRVTTSFNAWRDAHEPMLLDIEVGASPKEIIHVLSEGLLARYADLPLLDRYDVYQRLMDYWDETMQDDVYLIATDGWVKAAQPRDAIVDKNRKIKETPDLTLKRNKYKMDLIPPVLIVARYFAAEQDAIEMLQAKQTAAESTLAEFVEAHTGEEGLLVDALNDKGNITAGSVKERLKASQDEPDSKEEREVLTSCALLIDAVSTVSKAVKKEQEALDQRVLEHYATLTEAEIEKLVIEDKWVASIQSAIKNEVERAIQSLTERVKELEERYAQPLLVLTQELEEYSVRVVEHIRNIGAN